jgi:hypothetical protein
MACHAAMGTSPAKLHDTTLSIQRTLVAAQS